MENTEDYQEDTVHLSIPKVTNSSSSDTLTGKNNLIFPNPFCNISCGTDVTIISAPSSPSNLSNKTLVGSSTADNITIATQTSPCQSPMVDCQTAARTPVPTKPEINLLKKVERGISEETEG